MHTKGQVGHIRDESGRFIFVSLIFKNLTTLNTNNSVVSYPEYQNGGIINIEDIPEGTVDTTHEYIRMTVYVTIPGLGTQSVGSALFYNINYVPTK